MRRIIITLRFRLILSTYGKLVFFILFFSHSFFYAWSHVNCSIEWTASFTMHRVAVMMDRYWVW